MSRSFEKTDLPVSRVRRYLEPGPIVLVSSRWRDRTSSPERSSGSQFRPEML